MSTNFPGSLDTSTTVPAESASTPLSTNHVTAHQNIQDAIEAIEAKVGADSSAVTASHDYKLGEVTGSDKAVSKTASQTLTNKTLTSPVITSPTLNLGSDAEGDTYYRNSSGALVRLPRGTDNYIYKMNGNVPNWEVEATVSAATESAEGISRLATAAQITAGTATEGGYPLFVAPDQLALSTPVFNGSSLTALPDISIAPAITSTSSSTTQNIDTTITTTFTPKAITIYFRINGEGSGGTRLFSSGIMIYDGSTNRALIQYGSNVASSTAVTMSNMGIGTGTPSAGGGGANGITVTLAVQSISSTSIVIRSGYTIQGAGPSGGAGTANFMVVATR